MLAGGVAGLAVERQYAILNRVLDAIISRGPAGPPMSEFQRGWNDFGSTMSIEAGLGPAYNGTSCVSCHNVPALGGISLNAVVHVSIRGADGSMREPEGGAIQQAFAVPDDLCRRRLPADVAAVARRIPTPVFGAGLVEAIPDETLIALEDPGDRNGDGIRGRAARVTDAASGRPRIGRFGWKAQHATILSFAADSYAHEMGVTNRIFPREMPLGLTAAQMADCDATPDPEDAIDGATGQGALDRVTAFIMRTEPLPRGPQGDEERAGAREFETTGCTACHLPALRTTPRAALPALSGVEVGAYSDFLLHDIGVADGIAQAGAGPREMRTAPLWGLRSRPVLLHDGRATTIEDAIAAHGGEAERSRAGYDALAADARRQLLAFLKSL